MFLWDGNIITHTEDATKLTYKAWLDISLGLEQHMAVESGNTTPIQWPPDSSREAPFANPLSLAGEYEEWMTTHPHRTSDWYTSSRVPTGGVAFPATSRNIRLLYTHEIDSVSTLAYLRNKKQPNPSTRFTLLVSDDAYLPFMHPNLRVQTTSTRGKRWVWIGRTMLNTFKLLTLPIPGNSEQSQAAAEDARRLDVPFELAMVESLNFCDESATLVLVTTYEDALTAGPQQLHIFRF